jgi:hypothetical protein
MTRTSARVAAVGALLATTGALGLVVTGEKPDRAPADPKTTVAPLTDEAVALRRELERLRPGRSGRPAQRAVRSTVTVAEDLRGLLGPTADDRTVNALERELEYLDAVGSLLSNPRSTLAGELPARGRRARAALEAAPGGQAAAAATSGWDDLLEYAKRR